LDIKYLVAPIAILAAFTLARIFPGHNAQFALGCVALGLLSGLLIDNFRERRSKKSL